MLRTLVLLTALSGSALAWQLASKSLGERVDESSVIVVAKVSLTHSRSQSVIMGIGQTWDVTLRVTRVLKGAPPKALRVTFVEAAVQDWPSFKPDLERLWLLKASPDSRVFTAPASYESVLVLREESGVLEALRSTKSAAITPTRLRQQ